MALPALGRELLALHGALGATGAGRTVAAALAAACDAPGLCRPAASGSCMEQASTSYSTSHPAAGAWPTLLTARRAYRAHFVNRPNLAQDVDINALDLQLRRTLSPTAAALPVLKYAQVLNPRQTAYMLEKLPRLEQLHRLRYGRQYGAQQHEAYRALMYCLQQRLAALLPDCSAEEVERGLWGLTMAGQQSPRMAQHLRPGSARLVSGLEHWLDSQGERARAQPRLLSHAAWFLASAGAGEHGAMDRVVHLLASAPEQQLQQPQHKAQQPQQEGQGGATGGAGVGAAVAAAAAGASPHTGSAALDHRSLCRLAWAFSHSGRGPRHGPEQAAAWDRLCKEAAAAMEQLVEQGPRAAPSAGGCLLPRRTFTYRTVRGPKVLPAPMAHHHPSKYLRFHGPRVATASFDLSSVVSLVASMAKAGVRDARCLSAAGRLVVEMLPSGEGGKGAITGVGQGQGPAPGADLERQQLEWERQLRASALLPGTVGGLAAGPSGTLVPLEPGAAVTGLVVGAGGLPGPAPGGAPPPRGAAPGYGAAPPAAAVAASAARPTAVAAASALVEAAGQLLPLAGPVGETLVLPPDARVKVGAMPDATGLGRQAAGQLLSSFYTLKHRSPALAAAVLRHTLFSQFDDEHAPQLAALAHMASALGLRSRGGVGAGTRQGAVSGEAGASAGAGAEEEEREAERLMGRLLLAAAPLLPEMPRRDAAVLAAACARAGIRPGGEGAVGVVMERVVALGKQADEPEVAQALAKALAG